MLYDIRQYGFERARVSYGTCAGCPGRDICTVQYVYEIENEIENDLSPGRFRVPVSAGGAIFQISIQFNRITVYRSHS